MNRFKLKKLYQKYSKTIDIEITPRRWKYMIHIKYNNKSSYLTHTIGNKVVIFDNLGDAQTILKKLKVGEYTFSHNCPHTEVNGMDNESDIPQSRNNKEYINQN